MLLLLYKLSVVETVGSSTGVGTPNGITQCVHTVTHNVSCTSTTTGVSNSLYTCVITSTGNSTTSGISNYLSTVVASAQGNSLSSGITVWVASTQYSINTISTVEGVSDAYTETPISVESYSVSTSIVLGESSYSFSGPIDTQGNSTGYSYTQGIAERVQLSSGSGSSWIGKRKPKPTPSVYEGKLPEWEQDEEDKSTLVISECEFLASGYAAVEGKSQRIVRTPSKPPEKTSSFFPNVVRPGSVRDYPVLSKTMLGKRINDLPITRKKTQERDLVENELLASLLGIDPILLCEEVEL